VTELLGLKWKKYGKKIWCVYYMYQLMDKVVTYNSVYDIISPPMVAFLGVVEFILARSLW
jgi:hypothetical protein